MLVKTMIRLNTQTPKMAQRSSASVQTSPGERFDWSVYCQLEIAQIPFGDGAQGAVTSF